MNGQLGVLCSQRGICPTGDAQTTNINPTLRMCPNQPNTSSHVATSTVTARYLAPCQLQQAPRVLLWLVSKTVAPTQSRSYRGTHGRTWTAQSRLKSVGRTGAETKRLGRLLWNSLLQKAPERVCSAEVCCGERHYRTALFVSMFRQLVLVWRMSRALSSTRMRTFARPTSWGPKSTQHPAVTAAAAAGRALVRLSQIRGHGKAIFRDARDGADTKGARSRAWLSVQHACLGWILWWHGLLFIYIWGSCRTSDHA